MKTNIKIEKTSQGLLYIPQFQETIVSKKKSWFTKPETKKTWTSFLIKMPEKTIQKTEAGCPNKMAAERHIELFKEIQADNAKKPAE